jgi:histidinol dehydrogenase
MAAFLRRVTPEAVAAADAEAVDDVTRAQSAAIIAEVRAGGLPALLGVAVRLRDLPSADAPFVLGRPELEAAFRALPVDQQELLDRVVARVRAFAAKQLAAISAMETEVPGGLAGHVVRVVAVRPTPAPCPQPRARGGGGAPVATDYAAT